MEELVGQVRSEFRDRLERNTWLSEETRRCAMAKLDAARIGVGYPAEWIDTSSVDVRRDDYLGNVLRLNEFLARRDLVRLGGPVKEDGFSIAGSTLPIDMNAVYQSDKNGIEIPAAFLQPPFYDPKADAAVNMCAMGAVIGHEITHGFDSQGRLYDAQGNVRNWWTDADAERFVAEAKKLVRQADAHEVLPGLHANGALAVGENLADAGGLAVAYAALQRRLATRPGERASIDGLSPDQRCFLAWGQLWAEKTNEGALRQGTATDPHPPGNYRGYAAAQHQKAFYGSFGIVDGDPMWLTEKDRIRIW